MRESIERKKVLFFRQILNDKDMQNYEWLILDQIGPDLTPKAKYERLRYLLEIERLYKKAKDNLESSIDWFGKENPRYKDAKETYDILTGQDEQSEPPSTFNQLATLNRPRI